MSDPEEFIPTRRSLIERLRNWDDQESWRDFFETYWRLIHAVARKAGLDDSEAQDIVQETVLSVARHMPGFRYDPALGSFKAWLMQLTRWRIIDHFRKRQYERHGKRFSKETPVEPAELEQFSQMVGCDLEALWDAEWKNHVLQTAVGLVRKRSDARQFQMFDLHVCKNIPATEVAQCLGAKLPEVYFAKYKISAALKREIARLQGE